MYRDNEEIFIITCVYKNHEMTITPDVQIDLSDETIDYYGPEKLIQLYGAKEVVTK